MRTVRLPKQWGDASVRAQSFDEDANTIEVVWTTGAAVTRRGPDGYFEEELIVSGNAVRLGRLNNGASFLDTHRDGSVKAIIGAVVPGSARIERGRGLATIRLSTALVDVDTVTKIKEGVIRNVSVGYAIHRVEIVERDDDIPIYRVVDWEPFEISAVPVNADAGAQIRTRSAGGGEAFCCATATLPAASIEARRTRNRALRRTMEAAARRAIAGLT